MTWTEGDPDLLDLLEAAFSAWADEMHGPLPARVVAFNQAAGTCDAQPVVAILRRVDGDELAEAPEALPILRSVPIAYPHTAQFSLRWDLAPGDYVTLVPGGRDWQTWYSGGAVPGVAKSRRRFSLSDVIALPQSPLPRPAPPPATSYSSSGPVLALAGGKRLIVGTSAATDAWALASKVDARCSALESWMSSFKPIFDTHGHTESGGVTTQPQSVPLPGIPPVVAPSAPSGAATASARSAVDS